MNYICKRDPIGEKPIYYTEYGKQVLQSESINDLLKQGLSKAINDVALYDYLMHQYIPGMNTMYMSIDKMLPGWGLTYDTLMLERYWKPEVKSEELSKHEYAKRLRKMLQKKVRGIVPEYDNVGVSLSGGLDSSCVASLVCMYTRNKAQTFSVGFEGFSELKHAKVVSEYLGTKHREILITADMVADRIDEIAELFDEPMGDAASINNFLLMEKAQDYVDVVLTGDGGDEIFAGYPWHMIGKYLYPLFIMPKPFKWAIKKVFGNHWKPMVFAQPSYEATLAYMQRVFSDAEFKYLTGGAYIKPYAHIRIPDKHIGILNRALMFDVLNILPEKFCMKSYRSTKSMKIKEIAPFLDKDIVQLAFEIPERLKLHGREGKYILKRAFDGRIPDYIMKRKKQGYGTPLQAWLNSKRFGSMVADTLSKGVLLKEYLNKDAVNNMANTVKQANVSSYHQANMIWTVYALQLWYDHNMR